MSKSKYVIGIKRIRDYSGKPVKEPFLCYASYDKYADHWSTGYPVFDNELNHAITFNSVEEVEEKFKAWSKGLIGFKSDDYDLSSLAIMQVAILPKKKSRFSHIHD